MKRERLVLVVSVAVLVGMGLLVLASAQEEGSSRFVKQVVWVCAGTVSAAAVAYMGTDFAFRWALLAAGGVTVLLVGVLFSRPVHGVRAWFDLYLFKIQPAELARVALVLVLGRLLGGWGKPRPLAVSEPAPGWKELSAASGVMAVMTGLVLAEPDVGVAMGMIFVFSGAVFCSGVPKKFLAAGLLGVVMLGSVGYRMVLSERQKERVAAWLAPERHEKGAAWQMLRSRIAVGSGGLAGKGWGKGDINRLDLLPVKDSDFIFAVAAEELGFLAVSVLVLGYAGLVSACFAAGLRCRRRPDAVLSAAAGTYFGAQAALNMGVAMGLLPTTGVTLPFVSYGGSSILSNLVLVGLVFAAGRDDSPVMG